MQLQMFWNNQNMKVAKHFAKDIETVHINGKQIVQNRHIVKIKKRMFRYKLLSQKEEKTACETLYMKIPIH